MAAVETKAPAAAAAAASTGAASSRVWSLPLSSIAQATVNPIRQIVDKLVVPKGATKKLIPLSIGDPAVFGNLPPPPAATEAMIAAVRLNTINGYAPSSGWATARAAVAARYSKPSAPLVADDVVLASGASGAIAIAIPALANPGDNILIPRPGFSLYATVCSHYGIECRYYDLLPDRSWELDLSTMATLVDSRTRAILVNNPSNPCGSNYSESHLKDILAFALQFKLPIIADEIYADMVFDGGVFHALGPLSVDVPILTIGGIAKQYLVPGWRVGWLILHDKHGLLAHVKQAAVMLSQLILGPNTIAQAILPDLFKNTPESYYKTLNATLGGNARVVSERIARMPGLKVITPQAAMYLMVGVDPAAFSDISSDVEFAQKLLQEEVVFVLPGACFQAPNFFRIVFCAPVEILSDACDRLEAFCLAHARKDTKPAPTASAASAASATASATSADSVTSPAAASPVSIGMTPASSAAPAGASP